MIEDEGALRQAELGIRGLGGRAFPQPLFHQVVSQKAYPSSSEHLPGEAVGRSTAGGYGRPQHIEEIMKVFASKEDVDHFAKSVDLDVIAGNSYNLSVSSYVEAKDNRELVDITELNAELKTTVAKIDALRSDIDAIVAEIEGEELEA